MEGGNTLDFDSLLAGSLVFVNDITSLFAVELNVRKRPLKNLLLLFSLSFNITVR
jgi:hypothetical protein